MKIIKNLLVTVLCVSFLTWSLPVFAAEAVTETPTAATGAPATDTQICLDLGVLKGNGKHVSDVYLASKPNRMQTATIILRMLGREDAASNFSRPDNFADADTVKNPDGKNLLSYLIAHPNLGFQGDGTYFRPNYTVTAQQFYKVLLEALGYKQGQDFEWDNTLSFAADKGLSKVANVQAFTVNDVCTAIVEGFSAKVKGSNDTLATQLVDRGAIQKESAQVLGLLPPDPVKDQRDHGAAGDLVSPMPMICFVGYSNNNNSNKVTVSISCADPTAGFHYTYSAGGEANRPNADSPYLSSEGTIEVPLDGPPQQDTRIIVMAYSSVPGKSDSPICTLVIMGTQLLQG